DCAAPPPPLPCAAGRREAAPGSRLRENVCGSFERQHDLGRAMDVTEHTQPGTVRRLTPPGRYLLHMAVFLILVGFVVLILYRQIMVAFMANPALNGLIVGVLVVGCLLGIRQVGRLFREVRW